MVKKWSSMEIPCYHGLQRNMQRGWILVCGLMVRNFSSISLPNLPAYVFPSTYCDSGSIFEIGSSHFLLYVDSLAALR